MPPLPAAASGALVVANFLMWGHWPVFAKFARCKSVQPFGVVMVLVQTLGAFVVCLATPGFLPALASDSQHPAAVLLVVLGGAALAVGDFSAAAAVERLGIAVGAPVCFSSMLICGAIGDFVLEGSARPLLFFVGVAVCMAAVAADSQSHPKETPSLAGADAAAEATELPTAGVAVEAAELPTAGTGAPVVAATLPSDAALSRPAADEGGGKPRRPRREGPSEWRLGMTVAVGGGLTGGLWTVLSTWAGRVHAMRPFSLLLYFHLGEALLIVPVVLAYGHLFGGLTRPADLRGAIGAMGGRQLAWTAVAGLAIAGGYVCYFATEGSVPRPVSYAFGCSAGTSTGCVWGLLFFREYRAAAWRHVRLLLLALALYPTSIALIALSMA